ncbi:MAG TPA: hypothetical protein VFV99_03360 [Kofleriaceae bacterium]|nr:hypothetical protein [Kofleriaceae bacterium]
MAVRVRRAAWIGCLVALTSTAHAYVPKSGPQVVADSLTALPAANITKPLRLQPQLRYNEQTPPLPWSQFIAQRGSKWHASWDVATGVPNRIWGAGMWAPGTVRNADAAERFARQVLADHLGLLAPGAALADFELASNVSDGTMRTIGFFQRVSGRRVIGGQISFRFKNDRLFVIGSEALPNVAASMPMVKQPMAKLPPATMRARAIDRLRGQLALPNAPVDALGDEVIVPLITDDAILGYRIARPTTIDGGADGRYLAYVDITTGEPLAVRQLNAYASATVLYNTVDRYKLAGRGRASAPAPRAYLKINGTDVTSTMAGGVMWSPDSPTSVQTSVTGDLVTVVNKWDADENGMADAAVTGSLAVSPGDTLTWDTSAVEEDDAQVNAYIATGLAKEYVRNNIDAAMPTLDEQMTVNVNIDQACNAFFDGKALNFLHSSSSCQNTALIQDVVFHEYGHRLHTAEILQGVGDFDSAMSEGASDFLAASMTGDSGMGRGFQYLDAPLRELDPPDHEWSWPLDIGEAHHTGQIYGGIFWDLRKQLIADLGMGPGSALTNKLYLGTLRRAVNIPTSLIEALAEDDDDGNLDNGTPHECAIRAAFGRHGLRTATGTVVAPGHLEENALAIGVHIEVTGLSDRCTGDEVESAQLEYSSFKLTPSSGKVDATPAGTNTFFAQLPLAPQDSVYYKAVVHFVDGSTMELADNRADPWYQLYSGPTVKLYCTDFESTDPFADGWTAGTDNNPDHFWQWGVPTSGAYDPHAAFSGQKILALGLNGNYMPKQHTWAKTPVINIGQYSDVRLHYRRWLTVEDNHFDQATINANGKKAWNNFDSAQGDSSAVHHVDREWRFQDVPLSGYFSGHNVQVSWDLTSDEGLELGGWQLDDVCIVANPYSICGDGVRTPTEQCDNGAANQDKPDVCRTDCRLPTCGDSIVDMGEECDEGSDGTMRCTDKCTIIDEGGGCCSANGGEVGSLSLAGLVGLLLLRRRRR